MFDRVKGMAGQSKLSYLNFFGQYADFPSPKGKRVAACVTSHFCSALGVFLPWIIRGPTISLCSEFMAILEEL